jgi:hypothetical protein
MASLLFILGKVLREWLWGSLRFCGLEIEGKLLELAGDKVLGELLIVLLPPPPVVVVDVRGRRCGTATPPGRVPPILVLPLPPLLPPPPARPAALPPKPRLLLDDVVVVVHVKGLWRFGEDDDNSSDSSPWLQLLFMTLQYVTLRL